MDFRKTVRQSLLGVLLIFGLGQEVISGDFSDALKVADRSVILERYDEAREIYNNIIASADSPVVVAYAHYRLGILYKRQKLIQKARQQFMKGLASLKKAGQKNHQIAKYLAQAMNATDG